MLNHFLFFRSWVRSSLQPVRAEQLSSIVSNVTVWPCAGLHLIINEHHSVALGSSGEDSDAELAAWETDEAHQLLVIDAHTGLSTRLDEGRHITEYGTQPMNAFHAFHCPAGGFLLIGMLQPHSPVSGDVCTQQLLLYKLRSLDDPEDAIEGAMDLHWAMHTKWTWELRGCSPAPPACVGSKLAWLVGPAEIAVLDLNTQQEVTRLQVAAQDGIVDLQWSAAGRWECMC